MGPLTFNRQYILLPQKAPKTSSDCKNDADISLSKQND